MNPKAFSTWIPTCLSRPVSSFRDRCVPLWLFLLDGVPGPSAVASFWKVPRCCPGWEKSAPLWAVGLRSWAFLLASFFNEAKHTPHKEPFARDLAELAHTGTAPHCGFPKHFRHPLGTPWALLLLHSSGSYLHNGSAPWCEGSGVAGLSTNVCAAPPRLP